MNLPTDTWRRTALGPIVDEDVTCADPHAPDLVRGHEALPGLLEVLRDRVPHPRIEPLGPSTCITAPSDRAGA